MLWKMLKWHSFVFISPALCRNDSVFMITSIKHMQYLIYFLISLNISLIFPHKNKEKTKEERMKNGRGKKRGRKLGKGGVGRETVWLLPT